MSNLNDSMRYELYPFPTENQHGCFLEVFFQPTCCFSENSMFFKSDVLFFRKLDVFQIRRVVFQKTRCFSNRRPPIWFSLDVFWIRCLRFSFHPVFFKSDVLFLTIIQYFSNPTCRFSGNSMFFESEASDLILIQFSSNRRRCFEKCKSCLPFWRDYSQLW